MSDENLQSRIAKSREKIANHITDMGIWRSIVENIVIMNSSIEDKVPLLLEAIPDIGVIIAQLSLCKSRGQLSLGEYNKIVNLSILTLQTKKKTVDYNSLNMGDVTDGA